MEWPNADAFVGFTAALSVLVACLAWCLWRRRGQLQAVRDEAERRIAERSVQLQETEERTRLIIDTALDAVITIDSQGEITGWNNQAVDIFGWSRQEAVGRPLSETIVPQRHREAHDRGLRHFLATGEGPLLGRRVEIEALHRDGREFFVELSIAALKVGATYHFSAFVRDISARHALESQIEKSHQRLQALQRLRVTIWDIQNVGQADRLHRGLKEALDEAQINYTGCSVNAIVGTDAKPTIRFFTPDGRWIDDLPQKNRDNLIEVWRKGRPVYRRDLGREDVYAEREYIEAYFGAPIRSVLDIPFAQGTLALNSRLPEAFSDEDIAFLGELAVVVEGGFHRLRDLEKLEEQARSAEALAKAIAVVASASDLDDIFAVVAHQAAVLSQSKHATLFLIEETAGVLVPRAQAGHDWEVIRHVRQRCGEGLSGQVWATGKPVVENDLNTQNYLESLHEDNRLHYQRAFKGTQKKPVRSAGVPLFLQDRIIGTLSVGVRQRPYTPRDMELLERLGEQAVLAIERVSRSEELASRNAELERFTYTVSHDLKSPLVTIHGFLGLLEKDIEDADTERVRGDVDHIRRAATHMRRLLDDLLELSRIGRMTNPAAEIDLHALVAEALELVSGRLQENAVEVEVEAPLGTVWGDRQRLLEVYQNLLDNAARYMGPQQQPHIRIGVRRSGAGPVYFVGDNGIGIAPEHHEKVFGLFERLDIAVEGTGIGLALVKRIVEVHGGRIWIESEGLGDGCTFCFTLNAGQDAS